MPKIEEIKNELKQIKTKVNKQAKYKKFYRKFLKSIKRINILKQQFNFYY